MQLRVYQEKAVSDIRTAFSAFRRVLFVLATGGGKTVVFGYIVSHAERKGTVLILAHRTEIIDQISKALTGFGVNHGLLKPGERQTYDDVQVGMVQTVVRRLDRIREPNFIVIDEAHHAPAGSWKKIMEAFPNARILGVTATACRLDGKSLGGSFDNLILGPSTKWLIENGFLSGFDLYAPQTEIDLSSVKTQMGDYAINQLEAVMDTAMITGSAVTHYAKYLNGAPAIVFCTTVKHAEHVRDQFISNGFRADIIHGSLTKAEREQRVENLGNGQLNVLTSVDVVSEGFDLPIVTGAILLRPTKSLSLYLQQVGRSLRPKPDGSKAIILDHVGNVHRHGMPDEPREWTLEGKLKGPKKGPKQCSRCYKVFHIQPPCEDEECPSKNKNTTGRDDRPKEVDGELKAMQDPYLWAKGINIATAKGEEWKSLLHHADGKFERLKQIQVLRGYHHGWIKRMTGDYSADKAWWRREK